MFTKYKQLFVLLRFSGLSLLTALCVCMAVPQHSALAAPCPDNRCSTAGTGTGSDTGGCTTLNGTVSNNCTISRTSDPAAAGCNSKECDLVGKYLNPTIYLLSAIVGLVVAAGIIAGAIQYATAAGDPQRVAKGRNHIVQAVIGLIAYIFLYAIIQFLNPGGALH